MWKIKRHNLGDHVIILKGRVGETGKKGIITKIKPNPDTFEDSYVYFLDGEERLYYYYDHIEIDREWVRDQKLNKLINGIS